MKIFQIGFNKCGTTSLHTCFMENGVASIHWDRGKLAQRMDRNHKKGRPLLEGYEDYLFYADMEYAPELYPHIRLYKQLDREYPASRFILNLRDKKAWLLSRCRTYDYVESFQKKYRIRASEVLEMWSEQWDSHFMDVRSYFAGRKDFLEFDVERDNADKLIRFLPELHLKDTWRKVVPKHAP